MKAAIASACLAALILSVACGQESRTRDESYNPSILPANFTSSTSLTNRYLPFAAGTNYVYEGHSEEGRLRIEVRRLAETRRVMGIECIVVNDKVWLDNELIEDTNDWFAQDNEGTVWYFGEAVDNFDEKGRIKDHEGAWEAGVDGALPGIAMLADPRPGKGYRQEYYFGEAEDEAEVVEVGLTIVTAYRTFTDVIKIRETNALEPDVLEYKFYAPGFGLIKVINEDGMEEIELVAVEQ